MLLLLRRWLEAATVVTHTADIKRRQCQLFTDIGRAFSSVMMLVGAGPSQWEAGLVGRGESYESIKEADDRAFGELVERYVFWEGIKLYHGIPSDSANLFLPHWEHPYTEQFSHAYDFSQYGCLPVFDHTKKFSGFCPVEMVFPNCKSVDVFWTSNGWSYGDGDINSSLFELIERDFILRWWYGFNFVRWNISEITQSHLRESHTKLFVYSKSIPLVGTNQDVFIAFAARISDQYPFLSVGSAVRFSKSAAEQKAVLEAIALTKFASEWLLTGQRKYDDDLLIANAVRSFCYSDAKDHLLSLMEYAGADQFEPYNVEKFRYMIFNSPISNGSPKVVLKGFYEGAIPLLSPRRETLAEFSPHHPLP